MVTLSAKAKLFLEAALADPAAAPLREKVRSLGPDPWSHPLSPHAIKVAIDASREMEKHISDQLGDPSLDIDEEADLVNNLGLLDAVLSDLQKSLPSAAK